MTKIIVVSHGSVAGHLVSAAQNVAGKIENIWAVDFLKHQSLDDLRTAISRIIDEDKSCNWFILADCFGGSPCKCACYFIENPKVWVISGVNLPMIIEMIFKRDKMPPGKLCENIVNASRESIVDVKTRFGKMCAAADAGKK